MLIILIITLKETSSAEKSVCRTTPDTKKFLRIKQRDCQAELRIVLPCLLCPSPSLLASFCTSLPPSRPHSYRWKRLPTQIHLKPRLASGNLPAASICPNLIYADQEDCFEAHNGCISLRTTKSHNS